MEIQELRIWKKGSYETENPGRFVARVNIESPRGNMELPLAPEVGEAMLAWLAPIIAKYSKQATEEITRDIESQILSLKAPAIETPALEEKTAS